MLNHFRRIIQVVVLTFVLVFGTFLILSGFNTLVWSDNHHGYDGYILVHGNWWPWYIGKTSHTEIYHASNHGDTIH